MPSDDPRQIKRNCTDASNYSGYGIGPELYQTSDLDYETETRTAFNGGNMAESWERHHSFSLRWKQFPSVDVKDSVLALICILSNNLLVAAATKME